MKEPSKDELPEHALGSAVEITILQWSSKGTPSPVTLTLGWSNEFCAILGLRVALKFFRLRDSKLLRLSFKSLRADEIFELQA